MNAGGCSHDQFRRSVVEVVQERIEIKSDSQASVSARGR
jgi:hypothetical protein